MRSGKTRSEPSRQRLEVEALNWQHISMFGSFGESLRPFADKKGYVCWDVHIHNEAKFLTQEELEFEYDAWVNEMRSNNWGEIDPGCEDEDDPENYPDWRYLRSGAAAYAVERVIRSLENWRKNNDQRK